MEKLVKDLKTKVMLAENTVQRKAIENEALRMKLERRLQEDEKWLIRDRATFEKHFGKAPSQK